MSCISLVHFNRPALTRRVGQPLLLEFFARFNHLYTPRHVLPAPDPSHDDAYFYRVRNFVERNDLPEPLVLALREIEAATNNAGNGDPAPRLAHAIHQWLHPERKAASVEAKPANGECQSGPPSIQQSTNPLIQSEPAPPAPNAPGAEIKNQKSKIENPPAPSLQHSSTPSPQSGSPPIQSAAPLTLEPAPQSKIENQKSKIETPPSTPSSLNPQLSTLNSPAPSPAALILDTLVRSANRFVVLPKWVPEVVALFTLHTYAWELRDITAYLAIESPRHRCGKSTLLHFLARVVNRPEGAAHISSPAFFRTIQRTRPTLITDQTEEIFKKNNILCGILNASYSRELAYVVRVIPRSKKHHGKGGKPQPAYLPIDSLELSSFSSAQDGGLDAEIKNQKSKIENPVDDPFKPAADAPDSDVARYCCWCPKVMAQVGHFPETLADRCIVITMQRKTRTEKTERLRRFKKAEADEIRRQCAEFVRQHRDEIANAEPDIPEALNDRAGDVWEPLFVLADLAGGDWPQKARQAAIALSGDDQATNVVSTLLLDCFLIFTEHKAERMFTRDLVQRLNALPNRPWRELLKGKDKLIDDLWLAKQLRPFGIVPTTIWIGQQAARGYLHDAFLEPVRRYTSKADWESYQATFLQPDPPQQPPPPPAPPRAPPTDPPPGKP
jgi:hypothetical protein